MTTRRIERRLRVVGVIMSRADLDHAMRMQQPPDLFELRLDCLAAVSDEVEEKLPKLHAPLIITARHPTEGGVGKLSLQQRRNLIVRFLRHAAYIDVELRSAMALRELLAISRKKKVRRIISFHDFKSTPNARVLAAMARAATSHGADIFKIATRTDTATDLARLVNFMTANGINFPLAVMGVGRLGAISRVLLARAGSALVYGSIGRASGVEGQLSLKQLRALGVGIAAKHGCRK